ncbi:hypothetical protein GQX73_g2782 [Xylaria multiplex]|uniref:Uncharacterized protein n=1 Tax=Xylaria multiplex TaxID=323545 RepID=A0A7C8MQ42_9PEZI|nr:hypothetical protein GQX73_g2782 [Xylaria multiplex]
MPKHKGKGKGKPEPEPEPYPEPNPDVYIGYMHHPIIKSYYRELTKNSLENAVDTLWANILPLYFPLTQGYGIEQQMHPMPGVSKESADIAIRYIQNGQSKKICLIEDKRVKYEASSTKWAAAVEQLTGYMLAVRAYNPNLEETLHGIVTIGHYSRFYILCNNETVLRDRPDTDGNIYHFKDDEVAIDTILCSIFRETQ